VNNPNDFPITVTGVNLGGMDSLDFSLITGIPLVIPPNSQSEIKLTFSPNDTTGMRTGTVTLSFDLPKGFTQTLALSAYGDQLSSSFWARNNIHILPNEQTLFPIYARSPMQEFASTSLRLTLSYDPTHLLDDPSGFVQTNTLTALGEWDINNDSLGYSIYSYHTLDGSIITGGSDTEVMPIIYILFRSNLNPGDNPISFHQDIAINYTIEYDNSSIPSGCILSLAPAGRITLDSSCETVYLLHDTLLFPMQSYIEPINPNPIFNGRAKFVFDVPQDDVVRLDVIDMLGNQAADILDEARKPGEYQLEWNASGLKQGIYYVRLRTAGQICVRKIVVIK
jgi:hypothetical protein